MREKRFALVRFLGCEERENRISELEREERIRVGFSEGVAGFVKRTVGRPFEGSGLDDGYESWEWVFEDEIGEGQSRLSEC